MTESAKPLYELRLRGKYYQGIWQGEHCLAAICVKKQRGVRDAQFLLRAANSFDELLAACEAQHDAIDTLFAMLIECKTGFFPSQSGRPWDALLQGNAAIKKAKGE